eukprot:Phypoly_transcript_04251.p1 GENE.Phypoly_transcript_04251~~Phypoly_transcript_04251.p1  ORF type:complete len:474 (+),score=98.00 Phypoly_transcript_04251:692-2113(+)
MRAKTLTKPLRLGGQVDQNQGDKGPPELKKVRTTEEEVEGGTERESNTTSTTTTTTTFTATHTDEDNNEEEEEDSPIDHLPLATRIPKKKKTKTNNTATPKKQTKEQPQQQQPQQAEQAAQEPTPTYKLSTKITLAQLEDDILAQPEHGHFYFHFTNGLERIQDVLVIAGTNIGPVVAYTTDRVQNTLSIFVEPTTMAANALDILQPGQGKLYLDLLNSFQAVSYIGKERDKEGKLKITSFRVNILNIPNNTTENQIKEALHSRGITEYSNLTIILDENENNRITGAYFSVNSDNTLRQCTQTLNHVKIITEGQEPTWCKLEESVTNFDNTRTIVFSNLPRNIIGQDLIEYLKKNIKIAVTNCRLHIAEARKHNQIILIPNFNPPPQQDIFVVERFLLRQGPEGSIGEALTQFKDRYVVDWLKMINNNELFPNQPSRHLSSTKYHHYPSILADILSEFWKNRAQRAKDKRFRK